MEIQIIENLISSKDLKDLSDHWYGYLLKGAVDIKTGAVAFGGEWHIEALETSVEKGGHKDDI